MVGIKFDDLHSYNDLGLILTSKEIQSPSAKTKTIEIAGGDGVLDLTDFFGETKFENREMVFVFKKVNQTQYEFIDFWSKLQDCLQGKKVKITLDEDTSSYYVGRISMSYVRTKNITEITFTVDAEPYKMKHQDTVISRTGSGTVILTNSRKKVVPKVTTTASTKLTFGTFVFNLSAGEWILPELELVSGNNTVTVEGTGTTTFTYKEGGL